MKRMISLALAAGTLALAACGSDGDEASRHFGRDCLVLSNGTSMCGVKARTWCVLTAPDRKTATGVWSVDRDSIRTQNACDGLGT